MRPNTIKLFEVCFLLFFFNDTTESIVRIALQYGSWMEASDSAGANFNVFFSLVGAFIAPLIVLIVALFVSRRKSKISFWIITFLSVIIIVGGIAMIFDSISSKTFFSYGNVSVMIMVGVVTVGLICLYQKNSKDWLWY